MIMLFSVVQTRFSHVFFESNPRWDCQGWNTRLMVLFLFLWRVKDKLYSSHWLTFLSDKKVGFVIQIWSKKEWHQDELCFSLHDASSLSLLSLLPLLSLLIIPSRCHHHPYPGSSSKVADKDILLPVWWDRARASHAHAAPEDPVLRHVNRTRAALATPAPQQEARKFRMPRSPIKWPWEKENGINIWNPEIIWRGLKPCTFQSMFQAVKVLLGPSKDYQE